MSKSRDGNCASCDAPMIYSGRGRPRTYCADCTPAGCNGTVRKNAWLEANKERLEQERREAHEAFMAAWGKSLREHNERMEANRRKREEKFEGSPMMEAELQSRRGGRKPTGSNSVVESGCGE
jgi:hypothetical protein